MSVSQEGCIRIGNFGSRCRARSRRSASLAIEEKGEVGARGAANAVNSAEEEAADACGEPLAEEEQKRSGASDASRARRPNASDTSARTLDCLPTGAETALDAHMRAVWSSVCAYDSKRSSRRRCTSRLAHAVRCARLPIADELPVSARLLEAVSSEETARSPATASIAERTARDIVATVSEVEQVCKENIQLIRFSHSFYRHSLNTPVSLVTYACFVKLYEGVEHSKGF